jgi:uncharacterized membrane protein
VTYLSKPEQVYLWNYLNVVLFFFEEKLWSHAPQQNYILKTEVKKELQGVLARS